MGLLSTSSLELKSIEDTLRPMFVALPKNQQGTLEHAIARYALHRYFDQAHGWHMNGLDLKADEGNSAFAPTLMKDRAPAFIQVVLEQRLKGEGLGLHDLAVFAATLSNLVHQEAVGKLQTIFDAMDFPTDGEIPQAQSEIAVTNFVIRGLLGLGKREAISDDLTKYVHKTYPDWDNLRAWVADFTQTRDTMTVRNPFLQQSHSFDTSAALVEALSQNFGKYQNLECMSLKGRLVDMDQHGTGRVLLRDFYDGYAKDPSHHFAESVDYLRNVGALDETDPQRLSVMIPNYLMGKANCFSQSGFYTTCCSNECEGLLRHVEDSLASASASPARIADVISALPSDTVDAPRNLSSTLRGRLDEIAKQHGGEVPLHGRLFSQWMHHAYPRECPFPHVSGTTTPLSPVEWKGQSGQSDVATMEEVGVYMGMRHEETLIEELPWTSIEELVVDRKPSASRVPSVVRGVIALVAIASIASSLAQAVKVVGQPIDKVEKFMV